MWMNDINGCAHVYAGKEGAVTDTAETSVVPRTGDARQ
jgi:hypothetical protein